MPTARKTETAPRRYFIVNPAGAIHEVSVDLARERLQQAKGYRMATKDEIALLEAAGGNQRADSPLCPRWTDDPDAAIDL